MGIYEIFGNNERADVSSFKANKKLKESYVRGCAQFHDSLRDHPQRKLS